MTLVLADTTLLSNFAHVQRPELLLSAFEGLSVPRSVMAELITGVQAGRVPACDWSGLDFIDLMPGEIAHVEALRQTLGVGEAECIAAAVARDGSVLTDDRNARRAAVAAGLTVSGTLGVLIRLVDQGELSRTQADELLAEMQQHGYHSPVNSLDELEDD
jgi:predicted nucleic acid-binding protein